MGPSGFLSVLFRYSVYAIANEREMGLPGTKRKARGGVAMHARLGAAFGDTVITPSYKSTKFSVNKEA